MARTHDAQSTLRALNTHAEAILEAHLSQGNRIPVTDDNVGMLETLEHHRLIWRLAEDEDPQLKKVLAHFLDHITESDRRRKASEHVDQLWNELNQLFAEYREAKRLAAFEDKERVEGTIKEVLSEIIEDIRMATVTFSAYITSGFSYITDIELRIRKNEEVIDQAHRLSNLFDSFKIRELEDQAGNDPFLKRLLLKHLPATLEEGRRNLSYALNQLRILLVRMREDQRLSKLIGGFESHYANNRGFEPSIDDLDLAYCPPVLNTVAPFRIVSYGDIYDPADDQDLIEIARWARPLDSQVNEPHADAKAVSSVEFDVDGATEQEEVDPVDELVEQLLQHLLDGDIGGCEIRALEVLAHSDLDLDAATWLHTLESELDALAPNDYDLIEVDYQSEPDPLYPDNLYILDMTLRRRSDSRL
ncbi:hypothetical protein B9Q17_06435 [Marinobacter vinifirmus]|uniref:Uncharacterized protein n=1 Tax=Marinobacter vinifirmus TaxID=355591 RepID=A0A7Z1DSL6_9GAMM|nr:hypothetical protein [Marinobacter vinifirmus]OZC35133.1 hypothetical protein B9Q17_06435 [Marinobacter vinifirmus]